MIPIITATTQTTTTIEIDNEGAGWLKLGYSSGNDFDFEITNDNSNIIIGDQTGTMGDNILYADSKNVIFADSDKNAIFLIDTETSSVHKFSNTVSVENTEGTLNISDGNETVVSSSSPTWAYIPDTNGVYGFFANGGLNLEEDKPKVAVGSYAGVFAYNDTVVAPGNLGSLGLVKSGDYADGVVTWIVPDQNSTDENTEETPLNANYESDSVIGLDGGNNIRLRSADPTTGTQVGDLYYTFSGSNATVTGYSSSINWASFTSIPDTVSYNDTTYTITSIGSRAFDGAKGNLILTSLPSGLTNIGRYAFNECSNLALTSLPDGVTTIGSYAFNGCTNLALTSLPSGLRTIEDSTFYNCTNLALTSLPDGITTIGKEAFTNTPISLTSLPSGLTLIKDQAFQNCTNLALTSLPDGVTTIGSLAFGGCTNIVLTSLPSGLTSLGSSAFNGCTNLALTSLPSGLTTIPIFCFDNCRNNAISYIPQSVTSIGNYAFRSNSDMLSIIVVGSPTIGTDAFRYTGIKEVLNIGETEITTTSYGLTADSVQDYISARGYVAPTSIHNTIIVEDTSLSATLLKLLPVFMVLAVVIFIGYAMYKPDSEFVQSLKNKL